MNIFKTCLITSTFLLTGKRSSSVLINIVSPSTSPIVRPFSCPKMDVCEATYTPGSRSVAFVTTPDETTAKKLARGLIEQKLAACVNIIPKIQSIYMWEEKINEDDEVMMMIKTRTSRVDELTKYVRENHPYSVAEVITLPIESGNLPYLSWIAETVPEKPSAF